MIRNFTRRIIFNNIFRPLIMVAMMQSALLVSAQIPTDGLVAYYSFNGNALDESGNGNDGTKVGGTSYTADRFGSAASAMSFDGVDGYVNIADDNSLDFTTNYSISAWINIDAIVELGGIVSKFTEENKISYTLRLSFWPDPDDEIDFDGAYTDGLNLEINRWYHVLAINENGTRRLYVDGVLESLVSAPQFTYPDVTDAPVTIGSDYTFGGAARYFDGKIDDVRLYDRTLSANEVLALYSSESTGLVAHYPLDGNALDESGNGNDGTENGGLIYGTDRFENAEGALVLDGLDDNISIPYNNSLALGSEFSVSAWIQTTDASGSIFSQHNGGTSGNFVFAMWPQFGSGQIFFGPSQSIFDDKYSGPIANDGQWHHLVGVYDQPNAMVYYYLDGVLSRSIASPDALTNTLVDFIIGDEGNGDFPFEGKIDDVRLYSTAISGEDVTLLYQGSLGLVASYSFDGNANDISGNNLDGVVSGAIPAVDRFGNPNSAYYFDGSANIIVSDDTAFDLNDFTFSVWVSADVVSTGFSTVVGASNDEAWLGQNLGEWQSFGICPANNSPTVSLGWHHLVWVRSGVNSTVYLDNVAFESSVDCGNSTLDVFDIRIGNNSLGESFVGSIDDLKIYNYALSSSSVADLYSSETISCIGNTPDAVSVTLQAGTGTSLDASEGTTGTSPAGGDFYYYTDGSSELSFWANNTGQRGLIDLGDLGDTPLDQVSIPNSGYQAGGVNAIQCHTYVSLAQEGEEGNYIIFRVLDFGNNNDVTIDYFYYDTNGLVAHYPFNGNANDQSLNGNDATPNAGATLVKDRFGNVDAAYSLNGIDGQISTSNLTTAFDEITISTWFNYPIGAGLGTQQVLDIQGLAGIALNDGSLLGVLNIDDNFIVPDGVTVSAGDWHHAVMTYDKLNLKIYLDGALVQNADITGSITNPSPPYGLSFGRFASNAENLYEGFADDARVYERALSQEEVTALYAEDGYVNPRVSLMALYNSADGANWAENDNWGTEEPLSTWSRLTVDQGNVVGVNMATNNLNGTIPAEIGDIGTLETLIFFNNANLGGTIPSEIGLLSNMIQLNISLCNMTGEIPSEIGNLTNATSISFSRNSLSGAVPESFKNLSNLTSGLYLYRNQLTSIPDFTNLTSLSRLDVYENQLTFEEVAKNISLSSTGTYLYSPQTSDSQVELTPAASEEVTLTTSITTAGTNYQWFYNGEIIDGATAQDYIFNFNSSLEGEYLVAMTNDLAPGLTITRAPYVISDGINEAPTNLSILYGDWVDEGVVLGTYVGDFTAEDGDPNETFTYSLVSGEGDSGNSFFSIENEFQLRTAAEINLSDISYSLRVRVTDSGGEFLENIFVISVNPMHPCENEIFTASSGTITDGSGDFPYNNSYSCSYLIQLTEGEIVKLNFTEFDTEFNFDFVRVYDGENDQAPLLAQLSGEELPDRIISSSNTVYITLITDQVLNGAGFSLDYSSITPYAYYKLDNGVSDFSGNGFDGIFSGASGANDRFGSTDSALSFDGVDDFARAPVTFSTGSPFSVSTWVRWDGNNSNLTEIYSWWNDASSSNVYFGTSAGSSELRFGDTWANTGVLLPDNEWVNLVTTFDGSTAKIYINGSLEATNESASMDIANGEFFIGKQGTQNIEFFGGLIDEMLIYDFALSDAFISRQYDESGPKGLLAYLPFSENLLDFADNGFNGIQLGSSDGFTIDRVASDSYANRAFNFETGNGDLVELENSANYDFGDEITVMAWIRPDTYPNANVELLQNVLTSNSNGFQLYLSSSDLSAEELTYKRKLFGGIWGISYGDLGEVLLDRWTHVAFRFKRGQGVGIFINGVNQGGYGFISGTEDLSIPISEGPVSIGRDYDGVMDEVKIFSTALTNDEIYTEYQRNIWPFDVLALRGPESGAAEDNPLNVSISNSKFYNNVLNVVEGTYQFRATNTTTFFESFMGDNELDRIAEPGGTLINLTSGLHGVSFDTETFAYFVEPINSIGFIGSARTGDDTGWNAEDQMVDLGNGIYQIKNLKLFDGDWKIRMNNTWDLFNWGNDAIDGELLPYGNNIPISAGTYTITVDIINNKYYVIETTTIPVAELNFDGDLLDDSGFDNNGSSPGSSFFTSRFGNDDERSSISISASDEINIGNDPELNLSNGFSLNMWIYPRDLNTAGTLFSSTGSFHQHLNEGFINWRYYQNGIEFQIDGIPVDAPLGQWTMLTWTYDGGEMRFYDDGLLVRTETVLGDIDVNDSPYGIGSAYDGLVDDFLWVDGVFDEYEILSLYNDGYVASYALDGNTLDAVNGYDGIENGGLEYSSDRFGFDTSSASFDGVDDYVDLGSGLTQHLKDELSFSVWMLEGNNDPFGALISWGIGFTLDLRPSLNGSVNFGSFGLSNDILSSQTDVLDGQWHHIVGTYNDGVKRLYVDGLLEAEITNVTIGDSSPFDNEGSMTIGFEPNEGFFSGLIDDADVFDRAIDPDEVIELYHENNYDVTDVKSLFLDDKYEGVIDIDNAIIDVIVPSGEDLSALSYARIAISSGATSTSIDGSGILSGDFTKPVEFTVVGYDGSTRNWRINVVEDQELFAYYPFDGDVLDYSGNAYDADDLSGSISFPSFTTDPAFVGADQSYLFNQSHVLTLSGTANHNFGDEITVSAWIQPEVYDINATEPEIISNLQDGNGFDFKLSSGNTSEKALKAEIFGSTFLSQGSIGVNQWHHVAFTYQRNNEIAIYIDGALVDFGEVGDNPISISERELTLGSGWQGLIDELQIFSRALSDEEIFEIYAENQTDLLPQVHEIYPKSALAGETIRLQGFNLNQPNTFVNFDGNFVTPVFQADTYIEVVVPEGIVGPTSLIVDSPAGESNDIINFTRLRAYDNRNLSFTEGQQQVSTNIEFRRAVDYADIDNDGDLDIVSGGEGTVVVNYNNGDGTFGADTYLAFGFSDGSDIYAIETADFDDDGDIDIVFSDPYNASIYLLENNGNTINWPLYLIAESNTFPYSFDIKAMDFDSDGDIDLVSASWGAKEMEFLSNEGNFTFSINTLFSNLTGRPTAITHGDIDGDGDIDLVYASTDDSDSNLNSIVKVYNDGFGGVESALIISPNNVPFVQTCKLTDLDGDGDLDVITSSSSGAKIIWLENIDGLGDFGSAQTIENNFSVDLVTSGDLDGDGDKDIVAGTFGSSNGQTLFWYENNGNKTFSTRNEIGFNRGGVSDIGIADFDTDGDLDLLAAGYFAATPVDGWVSIVKSLSSEAELLAFSFGIDGETQIFDNTNRFINMEVPNGTDLSNLVATFILSDGARASVNRNAFEIQESGITTNDFNTVLTYNIEAEDLNANTNWIINVTRTDGMLAYYEFSSNTEDESGNGYSLTNSDATISNDRFDNSGNAYFFNGTSAIMGRSETDLLGYEDQASLIFWVNPSRLDNTFQEIISFGNLRAYINDGNRLKMQLPTSGSNGQYDAPVSINRWQQYAMTYDGSLIRVYRDGVITDEVAKEGRIDINEAALMYIGSQGLDSYFEGSIDGIRVFNYPLTETEILNFYNEEGWPFNSAPVIAAGQNFDINENSINGTVIGIVQATDDDGDALIFTIEGGNDINNSAFDIGSSTGQITVTNQTELDFETTQSYTFTIEVTDGIESDQEEITININDIDENVNQPPVILSNQVFSINEDASNNDILGTVQAGDPEQGALTYSIVNDNAAGAFAINESSGELTVADNTGLNFENIDGYTLGIQVSDGELTGNADIQININDVNEAPAVDAGQTFSIQENSSNGTAVGTLIGSDPESNAITFAISGNDTGAFSIDVSGNISVNDVAQLDFDITPSFTLQITVNDGFLSSPAVDIVINLTDINESPTIADANFSIPENTPNGSTVGTVTFNDPEGASLSFLITASLPLGNVGTFGISNEGVLTVADQDKLDYEALPAGDKNFTLTVQVSDSFNPAITATVTITIEDLEPENLAPVITPNQSFEIAENSANGDVVGTIEAFDASTLSYSISDGSTVFSVNATTGELTVADGSQLDFEGATQNYSVEVTVSEADGDQLSSISSIGISVIDANDPVSFTNIQTPASFLAGSSATNVGATISDEDGITGVEIFLRKIGEATFGNAITMTGPDQSGVYTYEIIDGDFNNIGIEYFFQVQDKFGSTIQGDGLDAAFQVIPFATYYEVAGDAIDITSKVSVGTEQANYRMLAFPFQSTSVSNVFSGLGAANKEKWRLLTWRNSSSVYSELGASGNLSAGVGYWFLSAEAATLKTGGLSPTLDNGVYKINLGANWNQIGNPFRGSLNWADVLQHNIDNNIIQSGNVATTLNGWTSSGWQTGKSSLQEFEGAFISVVTAVTDFEIPASAASNAGGREESVTIRKPKEVYIDGNDWDFTMYFETPSYNYTAGGIGMHPNAKDEADFFDLKQLPNFNIYLDMMFDEGVIRSTKEPANFKTWSFTVPNSLPEKYIDLTWDIPVSLGKTIILVDAASQQIYDLSQTRDIKLLNNPSVTHQLYYGDKDEIFANLKLPFDALFSLYPNPVSDRLNLELHATDSKAVKVEIISIEGKVTHTEVVDLQQGLTHKEISLVGKLIPEGVYLIKVDSRIMTKFIKL